MTLSDLCFYELMLCPPYTYQDGKSVMTMMTSAGGDVGKLQPLCPAGGSVQCTAAVDNSLAVPEKIKKRITM